MKSEFFQVSHQRCHKEERVLISGLGGSHCPWKGRAALSSQQHHPPTASQRAFRRSSSRTVAQHSHGAREGAQPPSSCAVGEREEPPISQSEVIGALRPTHEEGSPLESAVQDGLHLASGVEGQKPGQPLNSAGLPNSPPKSILWAPVPAPEFQTALCSSSSLPSPSLGRGS